MTEAEHNRMRFITQQAKLTVWIRQRHDGQWEAIDWYGTVLCVSKYRANCEHEVKQMSSDASKGIYAIATIVEPRKRQPERKPKGMRRF